MAINLNTVTVGVIPAITAVFMLLGGVIAGSAWAANISSDVEALEEKVEKDSDITRLKLDDVNDALSEIVQNDGNTQGAIKVAKADRERLEEQLKDLSAKIDRIINLLLEERNKR